MIKDVFFDIFSKKRIICLDKAQTHAYTWVNGKRIRHPLSFYCSPDRRRSRFEATARWLRYLFKTPLIKKPH